MRKIDLYDDVQAAPSDGRSLLPALRVERAYVDDNGNEMTAKLIHECDNDECSVVDCADPGPYAIMVYNAEAFRCTLVIDPLQAISLASALTSIAGAFLADEFR